MKRLFVFLLACLAVSGAVAVVSDIPVEHRRGPEQAFLTVPEWFLVFSPEEYAEYLKTEAPSRFPFASHIGQFWQSYADVTAATSEYPVNYGYHVMVSVIGASTTVEYAAKGYYEALVGRFTELFAGQATTPEDLLGARVAQDYVDFIKHTPWYEFDFVTPLKKLWTDAGWVGPEMLRKWERKYFLTTEYAAKAAYAWVIGAATRAGYEPPSGETHVVVSTTKGDTVAALSRYQAFTDSAIELAAKGEDFREIAGNKGDILVTIIAPPNWSVGDGWGRVLYEQDIVTRQGEKRIAFVVQIPQLAAFVRELRDASVKIEHIYDF